MHVLKPSNNPTPHRFPRIVPITIPYILLLATQLSLAAVITYLLNWNIPVPGYVPTPFLPRFLPYACALTAAAHTYILVSHFLVKRIYCRWMIVLFWLLLFVLWLTLTVKLAEWTGRSAIEAAQNKDADFDATTGVLTFYNPVYSPGTPGENTVQAPGKAWNGSSGAGAGTATGARSRSMRKARVPDGEGGDAGEQAESGFYAMLENSHWEAVEFLPRLRVATVLGGFLSAFVGVAGLGFAAGMKRVGEEEWREGEARVEREGGREEGVPAMSDVGWRAMREGKGSVDSNWTAVK